MGRNVAGKLWLTVLWLFVAVAVSAIGATSIVQAHDAYVVRHPIFKPAKTQTWSEAKNEWTELETDLAFDAARWGYGSVREGMIVAHRESGWTERLSQETLEVPADWEPGTIRPRLAELRVATAKEWTDHVRRERLWGDDSSEGMRLVLVAASGLSLVPPILLILARRWWRWLMRPAA